MKILIESEERLHKAFAIAYKKTGSLLLASIEVVYSKAIKDMGDQKRLDCERYVMKALHRGDISHLEYNKIIRFIDRIFMMIQIPSIQFTKGD